MPRTAFIPPCNPVPKSSLPKSERWLFEAKLGGWRIQIHKSPARLELLASGADAAGRFPDLDRALADLPGLVCSATPPIRELH